MHYLCTQCAQVYLHNDILGMPLLNTQSHLWSFVIALSNIHIHQPYVALVMLLRVTFRHFTESHERCYIYFIVCSNIHTHIVSILLLISLSLFIWQSSAFTAIVRNGGREKSRGGDPGQVAAVWHRQKYHETPPRLSPTSSSHFLPAKPFFLIFFSSFGAGVSIPSLWLPCMNFQPSSNDKTVSKHQHQTWNSACKSLSNCISFFAFSSARASNSNL